MDLNITSSTLPKKFCEWTFKDDAVKIQLDDNRATNTLTHFSRKVISRHLR